MMNFIQQNGGLLASVALFVGAFNIVMSAIQSLCNQLKVSEPPFLQKIGKWGAAVASWLSANVPTQREQAQAIEQKPPQT